MSVPEPSSTLREQLRATARWLDERAANDAVATLRPARDAGPPRWVRYSALAIATGVTVIVLVLATHSSPAPPSAGDAAIFATEASSSTSEVPQMTVATIAGTVTPVAQAQAALVSVATADLSETTRLVPLEVVNNLEMMISIDLIVLEKAEEGGAWLAVRTDSVAVVDPSDPTPDDIARLKPHKVAPRSSDTTLNTRLDDGSTGRYRVVVHWSTANGQFATSATEAFVVGGSR